MVLRMNMLARRSLLARRGPGPPAVPGEIETKQMAAFEKRAGRRDEQIALELRTQCRP